MTPNPTTNPTIEPSLNPTIDIKLNEFAITTDSVNGGNGSSLMIEIFWFNDKYSCTVFPNGGNETLICNSQSWTASTITINSYVQYHIRMTVNGGMDTSVTIQMKSINITDSENNWYFIDRFCICLVYMLRFSDFRCHVSQI